MKFLKWFFSNNGVVATDEPPKVMLKIGNVALGFKSPFRLFWPEGPSIYAYKYHTALGHKLTFFKCTICKVGCWSYKSGNVCGKWGCYNKTH
jgi:hypothetical protein